MQTFREQALEFDGKDELAKFRNEFVNDENTIYLDGNSLGKLPVKTSRLLNEVIQNEWGQRLIRSWNEQWIDLSKQIASKIAKLIGAHEDEIFVGDSTSLNLYKLVYGALSSIPPNSKKNKILTDNLNFPADIYVMKGIINNHFPSYELEVMNSPDNITMDKETILEHINQSTALVSLSHVTYKSSFMYDMKWLNEQAKKIGSYVIWDLSHAAGAVELDLNKNGAEMAVGCTYKYLNGGPGAPAFLYVSKRLQEKISNPIWAWFSHKAPFDFDFNYQASTNIQKFAAGTPSIISLAGIEPGVEILLQADIKKLRAKSVAQTNFLIEMIKQELAPLGFKIASPISSRHRGSHVSISHPEGYRINRALIEPNDNSKVVIPDFRPPDNIRIGIAPIYNTYFEIYEAVERIKTIVNSKEYERFGTDRLIVT